MNDRVVYKIKSKDYFEKKIRTGYFALGFRSVADSIGRQRLFESRILSHCDEIVQNPKFVTTKYAKHLILNNGLKIYSGWYEEVPHLKLEVKKSKIGLSFNFI